MKFSFFRKKQEEPNTMKYLIAGLGNIGSEYHETRHNIGFMVLDQMAAQKDLTFEPGRYGETVTYKFKGRQYILLKPSTYMNLSGKAVRYHMEAQKIPKERLLVVTDDLSLPFGRYRLRGKGSDGGHNGLKHIQEILNTKDYARMRVGIGNEFTAGGQVDYVLSRFSEEQVSELPDIIAACSKGILDFGTIGLSRTMNDFNRRSSSKEV